MPKDQRRIGFAIIHLQPIPYLETFFGEEIVAFETASLCSAERQPNRRPDFALKYSETSKIAAMPGELQMRD